MFLRRRSLIFYDPGLRIFRRKPIGLLLGIQILELEGLELAVVQNLGLEELDSFTSLGNVAWAWSKHQDFLVPRSSLQT